MCTYGIDEEEFMDGHLHPTLNKNTDRYGFEDFLSDFEGDVCAEVIANCWNKLAKKYKWDDYLKVIDKQSFQKLS